MQVHISLSLPSYVTQPALSNKCIYVYMYVKRSIFLIRKICLNWYHAINVRLTWQAKLVIKEDFFSTLVEILGYNEDLETRQDATELEWGYIHFPRNERGEFFQVWRVLQEFGF